MELSKEQVVAWLNERKQNCHRLAMFKHGEDKQGWLEDAAYFAEAINLIEQTN